MNALLQYVQQYMAKAGSKDGLRIGKYKIKASRWPWQGYGWSPHKNGKGPKAPLNPLGSRFGGGWNYKLGIALGGSTLHLDLLFGMISISKVD